MERSVILHFSRNCFCIENRNTVGRVYFVEGYCLMNGIWCLVRYDRDALEVNEIDTCSFQVWSSCVEKCIFVRLPDSLIIVVI